jgi:hypothetical protein
MVQAYRRPDQRASIGGGSSNSLQSRAEKRSVFRQSDEPRHDPAEGAALFRPTLSIDLIHKLPTHIAVA